MMSDKILIDEMFSDLKIIQGKQTSFMLLQRQIYYLYLVIFTFHALVHFYPYMWSLAHSQVAFSGGTFFREMTVIRFVCCPVISHFANIVKFNIIHLFTNSSTHSSIHLLNMH